MFCFLLGCYWFSIRRLQGDGRAMVADFNEGIMRNREPCNRHKMPEKRTKAAEVPIRIICGTMDKTDSKPENCNLLTDDGAGGAAPEDSSVFACDEGFACPVGTSSPCHYARNREEWRFQFVLHCLVSMLKSLTSSRVYNPHAPL